MNKVWNDKEKRHEWVLDKWYDKTVHVIGYITVGWYALAATILIVASLLEV